MTDAELLAVLETYYDAAPRPTATTEEVGPFTVYLRTDTRGWPYYARPRLGEGRSLRSERSERLEGLTAYDVAAVRARQRELGVPESFEWVHETTPSLLAAIRDDNAGARPLVVHECPLLVFSGNLSDTDDRRVEVLSARSPRLSAVAGAIDSGFHDTDEITLPDASRHAELIRDGLSVIVGAHDATGAIGGGTHSPRGTTTELTGIAVLPRARRRGVGAAITHALVANALRSGVKTIFLSAQDDAVARIYERVGFRRVGTACTAEPAPADPTPVVEPVETTSRSLRKERSDCLEGFAPQEPPFETLTPLAPQGP